MRTYTKTPNYTILNNTDINLYYNRGVNKKAKKLVITTADDKELKLNGRQIKALKEVLA